MRIGLLRRVLATGLGVALFAVPGVAHAQQTGTITGRVIDRSTSQPLSDAQVLIAGTQVGARTGDDGRFSIRGVSPGTRQIRVIRIGYGSIARAVAVGTGTVDAGVFPLSVAAVSLDQVITTATGETERKRVQGNAVGTLTPRTAEVVATQNPSQLLAGRVAGVDVQQSGGTVGSGSRIRIRGANSLSLSNEPLIIVDGVRFNNAVGQSNVSGSTTLGVGGQVPSRFNDINPEDIEKIEVLKGPAAAALYGTAAASGVIQVTTKRGRQQKPHFNAFAQGGTIRNITTFPANFAQIGTTTAGKRTASCKLVDQAAGLCTPNKDSLVAFSPLGVYSPFINGRRGGYGASVTGGAESVSYYLAGNYDRDQGVVFTSQDQRASGRANLTAQLQDNWNVQVSTSYLADHLRLPQNDNNILGIVSSGLLGSAFDVGTAHGFVSGQVPQAIFAIETRQDVQRYENSLNTNYQPFGWLRASGTFGLDYLNRYDNEVTPPNTVTFGTLPQGQRRSNPYQIYNYTANETLIATWSPTDAFKTTTTVGSQFTKELIRGTRAFGAQLLAGTASLSGTTARFAVGETNTDNKTLGFLAGEQFALHDRIFLNGALRRDRNSAFGQNFGSVTYPSISASWVVSEEPFFPQINFLSQLRVRAANGRSGRQPNFRDAITFFDAQTVSVNGSDVPGIVVGGTGNPALRPETSTETEFGFDAGFLDNRIGFNLTHYNKTTSDLLVAVPLAPSLGLTRTQFRNLGSLRNQGWEYEINGKLLDTEPLKADLVITGSTNNNRLLSLGLLPNGNPVPPIVINSQQQQRIGFPVGSYFVRPLTFKDANGDGIIGKNEITVGDTAVFYGNPFPTREISYAPSVTLFQRLRIAALFDHKGGNKLFNNTARFRCSFGNCQEAFDPNSPVAAQAASAAIPLGTDAGFIEDGSYTKFRQLSFTLTTSERIARLFHTQGLDLTIAGQNLHTWTNYTGFDPEVISSPGASFTTQDFLTLPPTRSWTARVNVTF